MAGLKTWGGVRITCPDIDLSIRAYRAGDLSYFRIMGKQFNTAQECLADQCSQVVRPECPNQLSREDLSHLFESSHDVYEALTLLSEKGDRELQKETGHFHVNWYNYTKLRSMLLLAGFSQVERSGYMQSRFPVLRDGRFFDNTHPYQSLYVEAVK